MSFDRVTGKLWLAEVGDHLREQVEIVEKGSNHQWNRREGTQVIGNLASEKERLPPSMTKDRQPFYEYPHAGGDNCIIGGYVYRGRRYPNLYGRYLYGDNGSGRIWAMEFNERGPVSNTELAQVPWRAYSGLSSFGETRDGEIYFCVLGDARNSGRIYELEHVSSQNAGPFATTLSETGVFRDLTTLAPQPGVVPYTINVPFWSDGAVKQRWIAVPGDGTSTSPRSDRVVFSANEPWSFPVGTVFIKHFELALDERNPSQRRRIETRLLVRDESLGIYGATYKWNAEQSEAYLLERAVDESLPIIGMDGSTSTVIWHYPSRSECIVCHNRTAGSILGVNTHQLNCSSEARNDGVASHQLRDWSLAGMFTTPLDDNLFAELPRLTRLDDKSASLETRARSYLDANCAYCHRPGGVYGADFDARFHTPLQKTKLQAGALERFVRGPAGQLIEPGDPRHSTLYRRLSSDQPSERMPPLAHTVVDRRAVSLLGDWIRSLGSTRPTLTGQFYEWVVLGGGVLIAFGAVYAASRSLLAETSGLHHWGPYRRRQEPVLFWAIILLYVGIAIVCLGLTWMRLG